MKKILLASVAVLPMYATVSNAQIATGVINVSAVNVRSGPSTSNQVKFILNRNDKVEIIETSNLWSRVYTEDKREGWIYSSYIDKIETTIKKSVTVSSLNMRSGPSTSYSILGRLKKGDTVEVVSVENGWAKIKYNGGYAYTSNEYLSQEKEEDKEDNKEEIEKYEIKYVNTSRLNVRSGPSTYNKILAVYTSGTKVEVVSVKNGWAKIKYNGGYAYISNEYLSQEKEENKEENKEEIEKYETKYVNTSRLNIRSGPSTSYKILAVYTGGTKVEVVSVENGWAKIKYQDGYAYTSNEYLLQEKEEYEENGQDEIEKNEIKYVNTSRLNIRSGPSTYHKILAVYTSGTKVEVVSVENGWAKIKYNGGYAYTSNEYLSTSNQSSNDNIQSNTSYTDLNYSFNDMVNYQYKLSQKGYNKIRANLSSNYSNSSSYINATKEDLSKYLKPSTFSTNSNGKLQFLRIDKYREGITASELNEYFNKYCSSSSVFRNKGKAFVDAAKKYNLDVSYLVAASMLETGYGTSTLAKGVYVTSPSGEKVKVYNFFGISAYDGTAILSASNYAYKMGWTTIEKTIEGSAKWLSNNYIHSSKYKQNTLYKMRWMYNTSHQYATDVCWANIIANVMNNIIPYYGSSVELNYEIPDYK